MPRSKEEYTSVLWWDTASGQWYEMDSYKKREDALDKAMTLKQRNPENRYMVETTIREEV